MSDARTVPTPTGDARVTWHRAGTPRGVLALGHGASTGIEAPDLRALAAALPVRGITVALVPRRPATVRLVAVPFADHVFAVPGDHDATMARVVAAVGEWLVAIGVTVQRDPPPISQCVGRRFGSGSRLVSEQGHF